MTILEFRCDIRAPLEEVWAFHEKVDSLFILTPPWIKIALEGTAETAKPARLGVRYLLRIARYGLTLFWLAEYTEFNPPHGFTDQQVKGRGPFKSWQHSHCFETIPGGTRVIDQVTYTPPFGLLGLVADILFIRRDLKRMFAYRHKVTKERLDRP